ncbi:MAG: hypothetical protein NZ958_04105 [Bacteroidia bacterium]|nr:hypothetical protein [Bacteroidia bacterium]MDW8088401.1 hypothetical protein [Bacteroidia bacterium]
MADIYTVRCRSCGASVTYDAGRERLKCSYCGAEAAIADLGAPITEVDLEAALQQAEARREVIEGHQVRTCRSCGAAIAYQEARAKCDFCGAEAVEVARLEQQPVRPQGVLPFRVTPDSAKAAFQRWLKSLWFAPSDLAQRSRIDDLRGVYLPCWTFDAQVYAEWRAVPGYHRTRTERYYDASTQSWKTRTTTYVEWGPPVTGQHRDFFDDLLVSALRSLPTRYLDDVGGFATPTDLRPYEPAYFLGWDVALPDKPLREAWTEGYRRITELTEAACKRAIPGDTYKDFHMRLHLSGLTTKLVYVPVYILAYRYGQKPYRVVIHGRSGVVGGDRPISWLKVVLLVLLIGAGIGALVYWLNLKSL